MMDPSRAVAVLYSERKNVNDKTIAPALQRLPRSRASEKEDEDHRKCTYRDFSRVSPPKPLSKRREKAPTFPMKLHKMLSTPEFSHIITWLPHGRSWRILKQADFEKQVLPRFFRHGRYSSFARQVNGWGFRRISHGDDWNSYYHELFLFGMPHLAERMKRLTSEDDGARRRAQEERVTDLRAVSLANPLPKAPPMAVSRALPARNPMMDMDAAILARAQQMHADQMHADWGFTAQDRIRNLQASSRLAQQQQLHSTNPHMMPPRGAATGNLFYPDPRFMSYALTTNGMNHVAPNNTNAMQQFLARSTNIEDLAQLAAMMNNTAARGQVVGPSMGQGIGQMRPLNLHEYANVSNWV